MLLRKTVPNIEDLTIDEIKIIIGFISYSHCLIDGIKEDLNIKVTFKSELGGKSDWFRTIELFRGTIDNLAENDQQVFKNKLFNRLKVYPEFVTEKIKFARISKKNIKYWILLLTIFRSISNDYYVETMTYQYGINGWYRVTGPSQTKRIVNYDKASKAIELLYYIMVINQFNLDDSKRIIKYFCCENINDLINIKFI